MQNLVSKKSLLTEALGYLLEEELIQEMSEIARVRETVTDEIIIHVGDELLMIPIVINGSIKVSRENESGNESAYHHHHHFRSPHLYRGCVRDELR